MGLGLTRIDTVRLAVGVATLPAVLGFAHSLVIWYLRDPDNACVLESTAHTAIHLRMIVDENYTYARIIPFSC